MATSDQAAEHYQRALGHFHRKEYALALKSYIVAAELGDVRSQFCVGKMCLDGEYYRLMEQCEQLRRSEEPDTGDLKEDRPAAVMWLRRAADAGYASAQKQLGLCYCHGRGTAKDPIAGRLWLIRAARQGDRDALYFLGNYYHRNWGGRMNEAKAFQWYVMSAKRGHPEARKVIETWRS